MYMLLCLFVLGCVSARRRKNVDLISFRLRESKDNIKCCLGVIIGILLIVGVIVGTEAQNRISSIANISESSY